MPHVPTSNDNAARRRASGFTLIELILVMVIFSVLASIASPLLRVSPSRRVEGMAYQMAAHLELARSQALDKRQMTRVIFNEDALTYTAFVDENRDGNITQTAAEMNAFPEFGERDLAEFITYGRGSASPIPGDASVNAVTLPSNRLDLSVQGLPEPWGTMGTVYLVHTSDQSAVAAISIASSGSFKAWRWWPAAGEWR